VTGRASSPRRGRPQASSSAHPTFRQAHSALQSPAPHGPAHAVGRHQGSVRRAYQSHLPTAVTGQGPSPRRRHDRARPSHRAPSRQAPPAARVPDRRDPPLAASWHRASTHRASRPPKQNAVTGQGSNPRHGCLQPRPSHREWSPWRTRASLAQARPVRPHAAALRSAPRQPAQTEASDQGSSRRQSPPLSSQRGRPVLGKLASSLSAPALAPFQGEVRAQVAPPSAARKVPE